MCLAFLPCVKLRCNLYIPNAADLNQSDEQVLQFYTRMATPKETWEELCTKPQIPQIPFEAIPASCFPRKAITSDFCITSSWSSHEHTCAMCILMFVVFPSLHNISEIHPSSCGMLFISIFHEYNIMCLSLILWMDDWVVCSLGLLELRLLWTFLNKSFWEPVCVPLRKISRREKAA